MLLSQFVAADGKLRIYEKGKPLRVSRPENECVESRYFEFEFRGKKTNNKYENWMSQIDGNAAGVIEGIMQRRILSRQEADIWATFVAVLFGRTRKVKAQISNAMSQTIRQQIDNPDYVRDLQLALLKH